jgi:hypothetical protein
LEERQKLREVDSARSNQKELYSLGFES